MLNYKLRTKNIKTYHFVDNLDSCLFVEMSDFVAAFEIWNLIDLFCLWCLAHLNYLVENLSEEKN